MALAVSEREFDNAPAKRMSFCDVKKTYEILDFSGLLNLEEIHALDHAIEMGRGASG
jgi:hypothetical protein